VRPSEKQGAHPDASTDEGRPERGRGCFLNSRQDRLSPEKNRGDRPVPENENPMPGRVVLIQPRESRGYLGPPMVPTPALAYLAGSLKSAGHEVKIVDGEAQPYSLPGLMRQILEWDPALVGVTATTKVFNHAVSILGAVKSARPAIFTAVGGPHASALPDETFRNNPCVDFLFLGEAEHTLLEVVRHLGEMDGRALPGVYHRWSESRCAAPPISDLDALPLPDYDEFPLHRYVAWHDRKRRFRNLTAFTARGCPYRCSFCFRTSGMHIRHRDPEKFCDEIESHVDRYGINQLLFYETFAVDREHAFRVCRAIIRRGLHQTVRWRALFRADRAERNLLEVMKEAGCFLINCGFESGDQEVLDKNSKGITLEQIHRTVRLCNEIGIQVDANYLIGMPFSTERSIQQTIDMASRLKTTYASFSIIVPYPGTRVWEWAKTGTGGLRYRSNRWDDVDRMRGGALELETVPFPKLVAYQRSAYLRYYLRPRNLPRVFHRTGVLPVLRYLVGSVTESLRLALGRSRASGRVP